MSCDGRKVFRPYIHKPGISLQLLAIFALLVPMAPTFAGEGGLNWSITPYVWATDTKYKLTADGTPIDEGKVDQPIAMCLI